ncbi:hypothetical protein [Caenispirillum salinarum]|uniref:hypothetical protein n=1 Tax=Caenispirillum salinarum TaxID=859058 RepID=UPI0005B7EE8F|nr:hypothetical protein [Caenispirillum salinarum]
MRQSIAYAEARRKLSELDRAFENALAQRAANSGAIHGSVCQWAAITDAAEPDGAREALEKLGRLYRGTVGDWLPTPSREALRDALKALQAGAPYAVRAVRLAAEAAEREADAFAGSECATAEAHHSAVEGACCVIRATLRGLSRPRVL